VKTIPVRIAWNAADGAERYAVYVQAEGCPCQEHDTASTAIVLAIPERKQTLVHITSRQGAMESISSEEMHLYTARW
jgi:hypothetical protein